MMKSKIKDLAARQGVNTPTVLSHKAWIAWNTAKKLLADDADISGVPLATLYKIAKSLNCKIDDLFEVVNELE
jgi:DNA-binding Xre family transcriptional regulator